MATFDWVESAGTSLSEQPRVMRTRFGDGYSQRSPDGLNAIEQSWDMVFSDVSREAGDAIIAFFRTHGGYKTFGFTPLWSTTELRFTCPSWGRTQANEYGITDIKAKFTQEFEP